MMLIGISTFEEDVLVFLKAYLLLLLHISLDSCRRRTFLSVSLNAFDWGSLAFCNLKVFVNFTPHDTSLVLREASIVEPCP